MTTALKILTNHIRCLSKDRPILMSHDHCSGPFEHNEVPSHCSSTAYEIVLRKAAGRPLPTDPAISFEEGLEPQQAMLGFLKLDEGQLQHAESVLRAAGRISKDGRLTSTITERENAKKAA